MSFKASFETSDYVFFYIHYVLYGVQTTVIYDAEYNNSLLLLFFLVKLLLPLDSEKAHN